MAAIVSLSSGSAAGRHRRRPGSYDYRQYHTEHRL